MSFREDVLIDWSLSPRVITVPSPSIEITIQDLYDTCRVHESRVYNSSYSSIVSAGGKESLGGGTKVGVTLTLQDAVIKFADRASPVLCKITGGNIVSVTSSGTELYPVVFSTNVSTSIAQSSSATITDQQLQAQTKYLIESNRKSHPAYGEIFYWDPFEGDDTNDGLLPSSARLTFQSIHDNLISSFRHDIVFLVTENVPSEGTVSVNQRMVITKNNVHVRGSGQYVVLEPTDDASDTILLDNVDGVEITTLGVTSGPGSSSTSAIRINGGSFNRLYHILIPEPTASGITVQGGTNHIMEHIHIMGAAYDGIGIDNSSDLEIINARIFECGGHAISLESSNGASATKHCIVSLGVSHGNGGAGIFIGSGVTETTVLFSNEVGDTIIDNGTDTKIERAQISNLISNYVWNHPVGYSVSGTVNKINALTLSGIADSVWDELLSEHQIVDSAGYALDNVSAGASPSVIADAVWDELIAGHLGVGSTGLALSVAGTGGDPDLIAATVWAIPVPGVFGAGTAGARLDANISSRAAPGDQMALTVGAQSSVASGVWAFGFTQSTTASGIVRSTNTTVLANLDTPVSTRTTVDDILSDSTPFAGANIDRALSQVESNIRGGSDTLGSLSSQLDSVEAAQITVQDVATGVWQQPLSGATTASGILTYLDTVITINLDAPITSRATQAQIISDATPFPGAHINRSLSQVETNIRGADNDTLKSLSDQIDGVSSGGGPSVSDIANGILDAILSGHFISDSVGEALTIIRGMVQQNYVLDSTVFSSLGFMTSGRLRIFASGAAVDAATDGGVGQGEIASFTVYATSETSAGGHPLLKLYKVKRNV